MCRSDQVSMQETRHLKVYSSSQESHDLNFSVVVLVSKESGKCCSLDLWTYDAI
jgi:hypothetical protein